MCGSKIGKIINKVTSFHDKIDPIGKAVRDPVEDALGVPRSSQLGSSLFPDPEDAASAVGTTQPATEAPATTSSDSVQAALDAERRRRRAAAGQSSTILTGSTGVSGTASTSQKTLLGV